jgi:hypothetical protein
MYEDEQFARNTSLISIMSLRDVSLSVYDHHFGDFLSAAFVAALITPLETPSLQERTRDASGS